MVVHALRIVTHGAAARCQRRRAALSPSVQRWPAPASSWRMERDRGSREQGSRPNRSTPRARVENRWWPSSVPTGPGSATSAAPIPDRRTSTSLREGIEPRVPNARLRVRSEARVVATTFERGVDGIVCLGAGDRGKKRGSGAGDRSTEAHADTKTSAGGNARLCLRLRRQMAGLGQRKNNSRARVVPNEKRSSPRDRGRSVFR